MNRDRSTLSPERRHLTRESIMRVQITLSSRRSSVVVFNTYARLVAVGDGKWDSVAVGAPCILLVRETSAPDSRFKVRLAIAEVESGIAVWEEDINASANYSELQPTFHTFTAGGQSLALQFADATEASSLIDCLKQYIVQKTTTDQILDDKKTRKGKNKKKQEPEKRISKFEISSPCEFRHLSGITAGQTNECQQELEGTIMRRQRSASMSAIANKTTKQRAKLPKDMTDSDLYKSGKENTTRNTKTIPDATMLSRSPSHNADVGRNTSQNRRGVFKSSSVRVTRRKPIIDQIKASDDTSIKSSTPSHSTTSSQEHSYWTIDDLQNNRKTTKPSSVTTPDHEQTITFKNSAPSQIQHAWRRNSTNTEDTGSKSSRSSTPHHGGSTSPLTAASFQSLEKTTALPNEVTALTSSPAHIRLNTSPDHQLSGLSSPLHVVAAANAKKHTSIKPTFNTYDTLLPLGPTEKLPPLAPLTTNTKKLDLQKKVKPTAVSTKPPPLSIKENDIAFTPPPVSSPGDLDMLSAELSKVLKDFDSLITPSSPLGLEPTFQYTPTSAKETMV